MMTILQKVNTSKDNDNTSKGDDNVESNRHIADVLSEGWIICFTMYSQSPHKIPNRWVLQSVLIQNPVFSHLIIVSSKS